MGMNASVGRTTTLCYKYIEYKSDGRSKVSKETGERSGKPMVIQPRLRGMRLQVRSGHSRLSLWPIGVCISSSADSSFMTSWSISCFRIRR